MKSHDISNADSTLGGSYVLRLWHSQNGRFYGYVLDAGSGVKHPLHQLVDLPALIRSLIANTVPSNIVDESERQLSEE